MDVLIYSFFLVKFTQLFLLFAIQENTPQHCTLSNESTPQQAIESANVSNNLKFDTCLLQVQRVETRGQFLESPETFSGPKNHS